MSNTEPPQQADADQNKKDREKETIDKTPKYYERNEDT